MQPLSTLDTSKPLDYDNLSIVTHPRPPRRRQSGVSIVPFRPYVRCLSSVRQPFSFANGHDPWSSMGRNEIFFTQQNARCIGTLIDDCDISDSIRWDIEAESTRLPMMCKLWIIIDGAVVERGKPHMVQDAAIQVLTSGRNYRSILATPTISTTVDRRRRQSWQDINEYHSVPYYQYTNRIKSAPQQGVQCNLDNEHLTSIEEVTSDPEDESLHENQYEEIRRERLEERVHNVTPPPQHRVQVSITTQTESPFVDRWTSIDSQFVEIFNLNMETNETLLSEIINPYVHRSTSSVSWETTQSTIRNGMEFHHRSVATGNDYPRWWLRLPTNVLLSDRLTNEIYEEQERHLVAPSPRQERHFSASSPSREQAVQTDEEKPRPSSSLHSSRLRVPSSEATTNTHYELIDASDDGNNAQRPSRLSDFSPRIDSHGGIDSHLSNYHIVRSSSPTVGLVNSTSASATRQTTSPRQSEIDYNTFVLPLNQQQQQQQQYSTTSDRDRTPRSDVTSNNRISTSNVSSSSMIELLARYQRTLLDRQRAMTIVSDELIDIENILQRYREKIRNQSQTQSNTAMELCRDISILASHAKDNRRTLVSTSKYRSMPSITSEQMLRVYMPSPRLYISAYPPSSPRQRQPRFIPRSIQPDYCELCLSNQSTSSAWIRYNENRVNQLQKRIDLMLQMDDDDQFLSSSNVHPSETVTQRIDQILSTRPRHQLAALTCRDRTVAPRRCHYSLPHRLNVSLPSTPRLSSRSLTPTTKSVRISTHHHSVPASECRRTPATSRPIVSILRRQCTSVPPRPQGLPDASHVWRSERDGKVYVLDQFSIPRYYRLYNDVSFREMYKFSLLLDGYLQRHRTATAADYSSLVLNLAFDQGQGPTPISSVA